MGIPADFSSRNRDFRGAPTRLRATSSVGQSRSPVHAGGLMRIMARETRQRPTPTRSSSLVPNKQQSFHGRQAYKLNVHSPACRRSHLACGPAAAPVLCASMQRIVVLNPKGGSGKTTIAVNLAGYFASRQQRPVLMDYDPQGSSGRWVSKRDPARPRVHLISAHERDPRVTRTFPAAPAAGHHACHRGHPGRRDRPGHDRADASGGQDPGAGAALGYRHPCLFALHPRPAAGGQDQAQRQSLRGDRQPGEGTYPGLPVAAALPGDAGNSHRGDPARFAELHPRRGNGPGHPRDEGPPGPRRHAGLGAADRRGLRAPMFPSGSRPSKSNPSPNPSPKSSEASAYLRFGSGSCSHDPFT